MTSRADTVATMRLVTSVLKRLFKIRV
jgi:hypothetical protein